MWQISDKIVSCRLNVYLLRQGGECLGPYPDGSNFCMGVFLSFALSLGAIALAQPARPVLQNTSRVDPSCSRILSPSEVLSPAQAIVSTLKDLYSRGDLTVQQLIAIRNGENPLEQKHGLNERIYSEVVGVVITQLKQNPEVIAQLDQLINQISSDLISQTKVKNGTNLIATPMRFIDIRPGQTVVGYANYPYRQRIAITKPFRIADIPVTQWQYAMVMKGIPICNKPNEPLTPVVIDGAPIRMRMDAPVTCVTYHDEEKFLNRLNQWSQQDNPLIYQIISNHLPYARIDLPTDAQWEFVARNRGAWEGDTPDGITKDTIGQYGWIGAHSIHPVRERRPVLIDGVHPIYDMFSNIGERVKDGWSGILGGTSFDQLNTLVNDPYVPPMPIDRFGTIQRVFRGACANAGGFESIARRGWGSGEGFRLIEVQR